MIASYSDFCETVERICVTSWRSVFGKDDPKVEDVDSVLVTHRIDAKGKWVLSFAVRTKEGAWAQCKMEIDPPEYDLFSKDENNKMPHRAASELAMDLLMGAAKQMGAL